VQESFGLKEYLVKAKLRVRVNPEPAGEENHTKFTTNDWPYASNNFYARIKGCKACR